MDLAALSLLFVAGLRLYVPPKSLENLTFAGLLLAAAAIVLALSGGSR